jgi:hypothetical protein
MPISSQIVQFVITVLLWSIPVMGIPLIIAFVLFCLCYRRPLVSERFAAWMTLKPVLGMVLYLPSMVMWNRVFPQEFTLPWLPLAAIAVLLTVWITWAHRAAFRERSGYAVFLVFMDCFRWGLAVLMLVMLKRGGLGVGREAISPDDQALVILGAAAMPSIYAVLVIMLVLLARWSARRQMARRRAEGLPVEPTIS